MLISLSLGEQFTNLPYNVVHLNRPQLKSAVIGANTEVAVWGRATGKSHGLIAPRAIRNIFAMPRSTGVFVAATFAQLLTRTLPPVIAAWEQMGYTQDEKGSPGHFVIGKIPPKHFKRPLVAPLNYERCITWFNGTCIAFVSQDRPGSSNGLSVDWIIGDEAKFLDKNKLDNELMPAMRGNRKHFGHLPEHYSILFCSDMPTTRKGMWMFDYEKLMDKKQIKVILRIQKRIQELNNYLEDSESPSYRKKLNWQLKRYEKVLVAARFNSVYYSEASAMENVDELGIAYFERLKKLLPDLIYRTAVLNERIRKIEECFYGMFNEELHTYQAKDNDYLESLGFHYVKESGTYTLPGSDSCKSDADLQRDKPLDIALDYGAAFNCMVVGQEATRSLGGKLQEPIFQGIKQLYVKEAQGLKQLIDKFTQYYGEHRKKVVNYYYDQTAVDGKANAKSYKDEVIDLLRAAGWQVNAYYFGRNPSHQSKHLFWQSAYQGLEKNMPWFMLNRDNCDMLITSMMNAGMRQGKNGFEKDKSSERDKDFPQEEATHLSDAWDMLCIYKYKRQWKRKTGYFGPIHSSTHVKRK